MILSIPFVIFFAFLPSGVKRQKETKDGRKRFAPRCFAPVLAFLITFADVQGKKVTAFDRGNGIKYRKKKKQGSAHEQNGHGLF